MSEDRLENASLLNRSFGPEMSAQYAVAASIMHWTAKAKTDTRSDHRVCMQSYVARSLPIHSFGLVIRLNGDCMIYVYWWDAAVPAKR